MDSHFVGASTRQPGFLGRSVQVRLALPLLTRSELFDRVVSTDMRSAERRRARHEVLLMLLCTASPFTSIWPFIRRSHSPFTFHGR